jgi:hypothetical protein
MQGVARVCSINVGRMVGLREMKTLKVAAGVWSMVACLTLVSSKK